MNIPRSSVECDLIISSTEGNISIPDKEEIKIGLNIYKMPK